MEELGKHLLRDMKIPVRLIQELISYAAPRKWLVICRNEVGTIWIHSPIELQTELGGSNIDHLSDLAKRLGLSSQYVAARWIIEKAVGGQRPLRVTERYEPFTILK
jgi:hypothetical protein